MAGFSTPPKFLRAGGGRNHATAQGLPLPFDAASFSLLWPLDMFAAFAVKVLEIISIRCLSCREPAFPGTAPTALTQSWRLSSMVERLVPSASRPVVRIHK